MQNTGVFELGRLKERYSGCADVRIDSYRFMLGAGSMEVSLHLLYCGGLSDTNLIQKDVFPRLVQAIEQCTDADAVIHHWEEQIGFFDVLHDGADPDIPLFSGHLLVRLEPDQRLFAVKTPSLPTRQPADSNSEAPVLGPRDGFVETIETNLALVRKRLKTSSYKVESYTIGARSQTAVALLYVDDIINPECLKDIRSRLEQVDIDSLQSHDQLKELISSQSMGIFSEFGNTSRPDFAVECLTNGRFVLMVDGTPSTLIAPVNITFLLDSAEDIHSPSPYISMNRLLRRFALIITTLLPGFWVSLTTYNPEQIPFTLLATVVMSRQGVPFTVAYELFTMLLIFQLFFEAGSRLPTNVGPGLSIVGGLIIGDAAIRAGLTSPTTLVIASMTFTASFTMLSQTFFSGITWVRYYILVMSGILGLFGFFTSIFSVLIYMAAQRSFGVPYLAPLAPPSWSDMLAGLIYVPWQKKTNRPKLLHPQDPDRKGGRK